MSKYNLGRHYEKVAAEELRKCGLNCIRVPLSKGFFLVYRGCDGKSIITKQSGDLAAWTNNGMPVAIEVKRIGSKFRTAQQYLYVLRNRLSRSQRNNCHFIVVSLRGNVWKYYTMKHCSKNGVILSEMTQKDFVSAVASESVRLSECSNGLCFALLPINQI